MKKFLILSTLILGGCLSTSTKTNLTRPSFSKSRIAPVTSRCIAPLTTAQRLSAANLKKNMGLRLIELGGKLVLDANKEIAQLTSKISPIEVPQEKHSYQIPDDSF